jgi:hypothetical protein
MGGRYQSSNPHLATILVMSQKLLPPVAFVCRREKLDQMVSEALPTQKHGS